MKTVIKPVYYCDYCKKRGLSKGHMLNHELHCTLNPNRECKMCGGEHNLAELIIKYQQTYHFESFSNGRIVKDGTIGASFVWNDKPITSEMILEDVDNCPVCALTIIRLSKLTHGYNEDKFIYDHKAACDKWWHEINEEDRRQSEHNAMYQ